MHTANSVSTVPVWCSVSDPVLDRSMTGPSMAADLSILQTHNYKKTQPTMRDYSFVVVRIDAHLITLQVKGVLTELGMLQLILVQIWPPPQPGIDDMWESLPASNL